jgi:hypothetical protein
MEETFYCSRFKPPDEQDAIGGGRQAQREDKPVNPVAKATAACVTLMYKISAAWFAAVLLMECLVLN